MSAFQSAAKFPLRVYPGNCMHHFSHLTDQHLITLPHLAGKRSPYLATMGPANNSITMEEEENGY